MPSPIRSVEGKAAPLDADDVDTDQIIPAQFLKVTEKKGLSRYLFYRWRYDDNGTLTGAFVLDRPEYAGSRVLVAGRNFGIGSSRENAVWALLDMGVECVVASSFGDIFYNNASKNGLLCLRLGEGDAARLRERARSTPTIVRVDLPAQTLAYGGETLRFPIEDHVKARLMSGMDDIALTTSTYEDQILNYEKRMPAFFKPREAAST